MYPDHTASYVTAKTPQKAVDTIQMKHRVSFFYKTEKLILNSNNSAALTKGAANQNYKPVTQQHFFCLEIGRFGIIWPQQQSCKLI